MYNFFSTFLQLYRSTYCTYNSCHGCTGMPREERGGEEDKAVKGWSKRKCHSMCYCTHARNASEGILIRKPDYTAADPWLQGGDNVQDFGESCGYAPWTRGHLREDALRQQQRGAGVSYAWPGMNRWIVHISDARASDTHAHADEGWSILHKLGSIWWSAAQIRSGIRLCWRV